jgi:hypothetical protein
MERFPISRISYSALSNFNYCPKYFELVNVKKFKTKGSPQMAFGTLLHRYTQEVLNNPHLVENATLNFKKIWARFCQFWKLEKKFSDLFPIAEKVIYYINGFMKNNFGNSFKVVAIEYKIQHQVQPFPQDFKGYIDVIIELDNKDIIIIDIKTAASAYFFNKYKDNFKEYQLTLYKKFYSELEKVERDRIKTYFLVIEKDLNSKKPLSLIEVSSGDKKIANAEEWLSHSLKAINANKFIKNRLSCNKFGKDYPCIFYKSDNCT